MGCARMQRERIYNFTWKVVCSGGTWRRRPIPSSLSSSTGFSCGEIDCSFPSTCALPLAVKLLRSEKSFVLVHSVISETELIVIEYGNHEPRDYLIYCVRCTRSGSELVPVIRATMTLFSACHTIAQAHSKKFLALTFCMIKMIIDQLNCTYKNQHLW